ncbi:MAG: chromosome segregation protein SMC [Kiritimatiellae bacterium]|nr:chromosome segregation protein SMC [Kiritimatiellia bacterium]
MSKTKLDFEPGMTAIVGPNGCGKSNISDAMRWVLGEQSAKALRGSKMEDVIFNGTDARKPLGMAEVSVTFTDCEESLGTDYHEVTITRRVFRSGEGQYFLNKTPCRLKDIKRLFLGTGVGTSTYSVLEQGRIDQILSSRPEDRRAVFEEASGITKFKADKKEAMRKLDQTEANLLRLSDVIREVKRQIGSLQRQAGKARRYKSLKEELQGLDLFATRHRVQAFDNDISEIDAEAEALKTKLSQAQAEIERVEADSVALRAAQMNTQREIGTVLETGVQARTQLDHTREMIETNGQRIAEYRVLSQRDTREIEEARRQAEEKRETLTGLDAQFTQAQQDHAAAETELAGNQQAFDAHREQMDAARATIQKLREDTVELEGLASRLQNELVEIETRERSNVIRRERLTAEKSQVARAAESHQRRQSEMTTLLVDMQGGLERHRADAIAAEQAHREAGEQADALQHQLVELRSQRAATGARLDLLAEDEAAAEDFPPGSQLVLNDENPLGIDRGAVLGPLANQLDVPAEYRKALEAALRAWLDAVIVIDPVTAVNVLQALETKEAGTARLLIADLPAQLPASVEGDRLINHITCGDAVRPLLERLIGNVLIVPSLEQAPTPLPHGVTAVTPNGQLLSASGAAELWMPDKSVSNPLARSYALDEVRRKAAELADQIAQAEAQVNDARTRQQQLGELVVETRRKLAEIERTVAQKEGESQVVTRESDTARTRLETVTYELDTLLKEQEGGGSEREGLVARLDEARQQREQAAAELQSQTRDLRAREDRSGEFQAKLTDSRIRFAGLKQKVEHLESQRATLLARVEELDAAIRGRSEGIESYTSSIERLEAEIASAKARLGELESTVQDNMTKADSLRRNQGKQGEALQQMEAVLVDRRKHGDDIRESLSRFEIRHTETRMQRQNLLERVTADYRITAEDVMAEPEEEPEEMPPLEDAETRIAELRTKLEAMGPVNLVAIEEYQDLQERFAFLTEQEEDLVNSKQQLMDLIKKINVTTSEMFRETFTKVNANFEEMFKRLFRGGSARLVMIDEEDVLESGIEIIARPPGKRLQNVSLLSGGERTLTAVSLLFAIYMIKPSPFCLLDELDAALDDSNIGRFVTVLKDFLQYSQFVVITHNRQTIAASDILYGVTMQEKGISNTVSMKFNEAAEHTDWVKPATVEKEEVSSKQ